MTTATLELFSLYRWRGPKKVIWSDLWATVETGGNVSFGLLEPDMVFMLMQSVDENSTIIPAKLKIAVCSEGGHIGWIVDYDPWQMVERL